MHALIVYAHPEPLSFNHALKECAASTLRDAGHTVEVSDLYAMKWNPSLSQADFTRLADPGFFKPGVEQNHAQSHDLFTQDIQAEHEKLLRADFVFFQFPLWWFTVPAILKGWFDRVMSEGFAYGDGIWYENGGLKGRRAMLSTTTGGPASMYSATGRNGDIDLLLWPIQNGILRFVGFDVLPPFISWGVAHCEPSQREYYLETLRKRLTSIEEESPLEFHPSEDYSEDYTLKPGVEPRTLFQQIHRSPPPNPPNPPNDSPPKWES